MSRAALRDDMRSLDQATGARRSPLGQAFKRDTQQFLNSAEYEFRKVVGVPRTLAKPAPPVPTEQRSPLEGTPRQGLKPKKGPDAP